jgi:hypothetical protein
MTKDVVSSYIAARSLSARHDPASLKDILLRGKMAHRGEGRLVEFAVFQKCRPDG